MDKHNKLVSALTEWDTKQSKKAGHNRYFLGIALNALHALHDIESELPNATAQELAKEAFEGRLLTFVLSYLEKHP